LSNPTTQAVTVLCPDGYQLTGATYRAQSDLGRATVGVHASVWGPDRYFVVLANAGIYAETVVVEIVCGRATGRVAGRQVELRKPVQRESDLTLGRAETGSTAVSCPTKTFPTFGGIERAQRTRSVGSHPMQTSQGRSWFHSLFNDSTEPKTLPVTAVCVREKLRFADRSAAASRRRSAPRLRPQFAVKTADLPAGSRRTVKSKCKQGYTVAGGGWGLDGTPGADSLGGRFRKRSLSVTFTADRVDAAAGVTAVCVRRKIR
jgi:hypothetical protein